MTEHPDSEHDPAQSNHGHEDSKSSHLRSVFIWGGIAVAGLLAASIWWPNLTERTKFFTANLLNLVIALAVVAQALIYRRQRDIMRGQWRVMKGQGKAMQDQLEAMREQYAAEKDFMKLQIHNLSDQSDVMEASYELSKQSIRQNEQTVKAMQGQLTAMERQEQAMRDQAKLMDRSLVFGTRAYVGVHSVTFEPQRKRIILQVENIGRVPAKDIQVIVELMIRIPDHLMPPPAPDGTRRGWEFREGVRPSNPGGTPLGEWELRIPWVHPYGRTKLFPGSLRIGIVIRLGEVLYLTPQQYDAITAGHAMVFVRGIITYSDGFHKGKKTEFAFRYYLRDDLWISLPETGFEKYTTEPEQPDSDYNPN